MNRGIMRVSEIVFIGLLMVALNLAVSPSPAFSGEKAKATFKKSCASCHGVEGKGDGLMSASFPVKPVDWTDCGAMKKLTDDKLFNTIKKGGAATGQSALMPPWESALSDSEIKDLVAFVRSHCKK